MYGLRPFQTDIKSFGREPDIGQGEMTSRVKRGDRLGGNRALPHEAHVHEEDRLLNWEAGGARGEVSHRRLKRGRGGGVLGGGGVA